MNEPSMNMLPNDHHPGPRCSCAECLREYRAGASNIAAIRAVIAEMIHVAADGDRDADWTADNCAKIDAWQVRLADAVAGLPPAVTPLKRYYTLGWELHQQASMCQQNCRPVYLAEEVDALLQSSGDAP